MPYTEIIEVMMKRIWILATVGMLFFPHTGRALTGGPMMPEYVQFEPYNAKDIVSLTTGDFVYTIPLLNVPGPGGDFPVALSYHSGIQHDQEATWVGLGWSLNAGAINRLVRGYPDDYFDAHLHAHTWNNGASSWGLVHVNRLAI